MRIEASQVSYAATHRSVDATTVIDQTVASPAALGGVVRVPVDRVQLSALAQASGNSDVDELQDMDPKDRLALLAIWALLGHKTKFLRFTPPGSAASTSALATSVPSGGGEPHRRIELHAEAEQTTFHAEGVVETADGRQIQFSARLDLQREFQSATAGTVPAATTDPLVVNYGGAPAQLTAAKISFDLNSDGKPESISFVAGGSGFLVLDKNGDGKVNDGRELFGPGTGNGFAELAGYDADGNGWIDQNDPVFSGMRIWSQDGLSSLLEKGIGAISTDSVATPFAMKDDANQLQADVRRTGIYLSEDGSAGTVQQLDLAQE